MDRAILKALGIHGEVYSDVELDNKKGNVNEKQGIDLNRASIIQERLKSISSKANLQELLSDNKEYLTQLNKQNSKLCQQIVEMIKNKQQQL